MAKVATVGVMLTASGDGLEAGLIAAESRVQEFANRTEGVLSKIGSSGFKPTSFSMLEALDDELELMKAQTDEQRKRIQLAHEYRDALKAITASSASELDKAGAFTRVNQINALRSKEIDQQELQSGNIFGGGGKLSKFIDNTRQGVMQLAAAGAQIKLVAQTVKIAADGMQTFAREALDGSKSWDRMVQSAMDATPVLGEATTATQKIMAATQDTFAALSKWFGASDEFVEARLSDETHAAKVNEKNAANERMRQRERDGMAMVQAYEDELALLQAATEIDRERLRLQFELRDELKKIDAAGNNSHRQEAQNFAEIINDEKLRQLEERAEKESAAKIGEAFSTEAEYWFGRLDKVNETLKDAKKADDKATEDAKNAAAKIIESTRTPIETYTAKLAEIDKLLASGHLGADDAVRAAQAAQQAAGLGGGKHVLAGITEAGSVAAYRNSVRAVDTGKIDREQLAEAKKQTGLLQKTLAAKGKQIELLPSSM